MTVAIMTLALVQIWVENARPVDEEYVVGSDYDCGTIAVYLMCRLEGVRLGIGDIAARLPEARRGGFSMKELANTAKLCGLPLTGIQLELESDSAPVLDGPMIVFFRRKAHGHFVVIRPVGHTGKLVQVIDSALAPEVVDSADLVNSPDWTGMALAPTYRTRWLTRNARLCFGVAGVACLGLGVLCRVWERWGGKGGHTGMALS